MFVPPASILALGYLYRFLRNPQYATDGGVSLPEWEDWIRLLRDGCRLFFFVLAYAVISICLSLAAKFLVIFSSLSFIRPTCLVFWPFMAVLLLPVFLVCLTQYQRRERVRDLLNLGHLCHYLRFVWWPWVWPALGFVGLACACQLLYGITFFIGFGVVFASYNELLRHFGDRIDPR
jgi:hypothetical protein